MKPLFIRFLRLLRIRSTRPQTFLIPAYAGLGNFIMATPMILELKRRIPDARIYLLTWPWYGTDQIFAAPIAQAGERMRGSGYRTQDTDHPPVEGVFLLDPKASPWRKAVLRACCHLLLQCNPRDRRSSHADMGGAEIDDGTSVNKRGKTDREKFLMYAAVLGMFLSW